MDDPASRESAADTAAVEKEEDRQVLFDGESFAGWRGFRREDIPIGWAITEDGTLQFTNREGDINQGLITVEEFSDFELRFQWRVAPGGNSGVFFYVTEEEDAIWKTGPEYQIVDNFGHADGENPTTSAGANYGLHGPDENFARPIDEFNEGRIVARDGRVEHFLNGRRVVEYELESEAWESLVADSPFRTMSGYGRSGSGHIALQEGGPVWYRNLTIRRLDSSE